MHCARAKRVPARTLAILCLFPAIYPIGHAYCGVPSYSVLYTFPYDSNGYPEPGSLIQDEQGHLYGMTALGGKPSSGNNFECGAGCGTVFQLDPGSGDYTVIHEFGGAGGEYPVGGLIRDQQGHLYGATGIGGTFQQGTVFGLDAAGNETFLHSFSEDGNGYRPMSGLVGDEERNLYGTTAWGSSPGCQAGCGVVFEISSSGEYTVLHSFAGPPNDGGNSYAPLIRDKLGNLYGTTVFGGSSNNGTVFKVSPEGTEIVLHSFTGADGSQPSSGLTTDESGNLYGVTSSGGSGGYGVVFELDSSRRLTVLYSFTGKEDGGSPAGKLFLDERTGNLFGTAFGGGIAGLTCPPGGCGAIFEVSPSGKEKVLYYFQGSDGAEPYTGVIGRCEPHGELDLFGTTQDDLSGTTSQVIFKLVVPADAQ